MTDQATVNRRRTLVRETLNAEDLAAIGEVAVRAAVLDHMIEITVERIARDYPSIIKRRALTLSSTQMLEVVVEVLKADNPQHLEAIDSFAAEVVASRARRNSVVHSVWMKGPDETTKVLVDPREWKGQISETIGHTDIKALADSLIDLTFELSDWKTLPYRKARASEDVRLPTPSAPR
jgi:hypothetical protein